MLPRPVSYPKQGIVISKRWTLGRLQSRARITNLGVLFLATLALFSLFLNFHLLTSPSASPKGILSTSLDRTTQFAALDHFILASGHAIWNGLSPDRRLDEKMWLLEPYQKNSGRLEAFYQHIAQAVKLTLQDKHSLLIFSGGQTHVTATTTEAESYLRLAKQSNFFANDFRRVTTENYALDSYQNLLFSIARFHEYTGTYPTTITIVGYEMKRKRFTDLHRAAIRWPLQRFHYVGIDSNDPVESAAADSSWRGTPSIIMIVNRS
ncbi:hypothetical protein D9757_005643 [Collybiopsis confluens]|uniref:DUF218 domain-containing protein n=1 Tax=Collybiopsis confluens TaxID=2823264 RepID=A0A8H5HSL3_9AGAR|nr:hypothetical protein D9757_005643 [Collybiopsis confluens]